MAKPGGGMNMYNNRQGNNSFRRDNRNNNHQQNQGGQNKRTHSGNYSGPNNQQNQSRQQNNQNSNNKQVNNRASLEKPSPVKPAREGAPPSKAVKKEEAPPLLAPAVAIVAETVPVVEEAEVEASEVKVEPTKINEVANALTSGKKFTGRCRLFVGNITQDCNEVEFRKLFEPYGEVSEVYVNSSRGFGFIRLDYRHNAEAAKAALDGYQRKGRVLRIRFATHGAALKVKNLHTYVSNELLEQGFSQFGELERCVVIVDDKGKSTGEGIVEFVRKPGASSALRRITDGVFLLGADPKPIQVEPLEQKDEEDGQPEKFLSRTEQYKKEREKEPRFAPPGTFEFEFGMRWKQLEDLENKRIEQIKKDTEDARHKLEDEMQNALYEYQADQIRQDLLRQQEELRRLEELRNADRMRRQEEQERRREQTDRQGEERRRADLMMTLRQQDIASRRGPIDEGDMRRREEMMMADRFADRMGDRGMPERGMQERGMQERGMQERGMQERMSERDMDRMRDMQNQNFMRGEGGMRGGDNQRGGRDMRDSGAPPLQPPPIPPTMNRGGPAGAAAAIAAKGSPGPKPLFPPGGPNGGPMDKARFEEQRDFQNQRGVLGQAPGQMGPGGPSPYGPGAGAAAAAAAALQQMRQGGGRMGGPEAMFPGGNPMNERMMLERRRAAAREELGDIKRMRRM